MKRKCLVGWFAMIACCFSLMACGAAQSTDTASGDSVSADSSSESGDSTDDTATLTDAQGNEIALTETEDYGIGGTYVCAADSSVWSFGGDHLAVAYNDEDGNLGSYICELTFYQTEADENGDVHLCVVIYNQNTDETSYWYVTNIVDDDKTNIGLQLQMPGDSDNYVQLLTQDYMDSQSTNTESSDSDSQE